MPRMLPDGRRLGAHLPLGDGMVKAVERAHEIGAGALQVFVDNPTAWRRRQEPPGGAAGVPDPPDRARHRAGRRPRLVPGQPGRDRGGLLRPLRGGPRQRPACGAGLRRSVRQRPRRVAPRVPAWRPARSAWPMASRSPWPRSTTGPTRRWSCSRTRPAAGSGWASTSPSWRRSPRPPRLAACRRGGSGSASTRRMRGPPGSTSPSPPRSMRSWPTSTIGSGSTGW